MQRTIFITVISLISVSILYSQPAMKLGDVISLIQANHPSLKMYDAEIRSMDEAARGAKSWEAPELGTGFWMTPYNTALWKKSGSETGMGQYMITVTQMIPNKKELDANAKYMEAQSSLNMITKQATLNELCAAAKKSYYAWMVIQKKLTVIDESRKLLVFMMESTELRYKNNLGKLDAYYKVKAAIANIENMRVALQNEIKRQQISLNTLMNRNKEVNFTIDTSYSIKDYSNEDSSYFLHARSDIKAIDKNVVITYLQQDLERTKLKPQFGVNYGHMFGFGGFPEQFTLMATVKLPIANWSAKSFKANIESLHWKAESYNQQKQMVLNEASGDQARMIADIESKKRQMSLYENAIIPALVKNYQTTQISYEQNTEELFALFDAWQSLNMTQLEYLQQLQDLLWMQAELERILEIK
ncbi:MAG: TolC family protein [Chitinophagales bacterium]